METWCLIFQAYPGDPHYEVMAHDGHPPDVYERVFQHPLDVRKMMMVDPADPLNKECDIHLPWTTVQYHRTHLDLSRLVAVYVQVY